MCGIITTTFMEETALVKLQFGLLHKFREKQKRNVKKKLFGLLWIKIVKELPSIKSSIFVANTNRQPDPGSTIHFPSFQILFNWCFVYDTKQ